MRRAANSSMYQLSARLALHAGRYSDALGMVEAALKVTSEFNLNGLARLNYMRGKILQAAAHPAARTSFPFVAARPDIDSMQSFSYTRSGEVLAECGAAYTKAYKLYRAAGDDKWVAKTVARIAQAYLERLVAPVLLLKVPMEKLTRLSGANLPGRLSQLTLEEIEAPAALALELSSEIPAPFLALRAQLNAAELRLLRNERPAAATLAKDAMDTLMGIFIDPSTNAPVLRHAAPAFLRKLLHFFQRTARVLLCIGGDSAAQSGSLLEALLHLETSVTCARRRSVKEGTAQGSTGMGRQRFRQTLGLSAPHKANQPAIKSDFPSALPLKDTIRLPRGAPSPYAAAGGNVSHMQIPLQGGGSSTGGGSSPSTSTSSLSSRGMPRAAAEALEAERSASLAVDEAAEQIWAALLLLKPLATNYVAGRISQEDALQQGRRAMQSIGRTLQALRAQCAALKRATTGVVASGSGSPRSRIGVRKSLPRYEEMFGNTSTPRLAYVLQLDEYVVFFAPLNSAMKVVRFGGQEHVLDEAPGSISPAETIPVRISVHDTPEEFISFSMRADTVIERLSAFLFSGDWRGLAEGPREKETKKDKKGAAADEFKVLGQSRLFAKQFARIVNANTKGCVLVGKGQGGFYTLAPNTRTLFDTYGPAALAALSDPAPLQLAVCPPTESLGKAPVVVGPSVSSSTSGTNVSDSSRVKLSRNTIEYLHRTLYIPADADSTCDAIAARDELRTIFAPARALAAALPQGEYRGHLTLLCAGVVNSLPFELLFDEPVVRAPSLASFLARDTREAAGPPLYLVPYYSESATLGDKGQAMFEARKEWLANAARADLHLSLSLPSGSRVLANEVMPTPLVKWGKKQPKSDKKGMPLVSYVDMSQIEHFTDLGYVLDAQSGAQTVFVATLADLVCPTEALQFLFASQCVVLVVPEVKLRQVIAKFTVQQEKILKSNARALRTNKELASMLLSTAFTASGEEHVPVVIINLPR